MIRRSSRQSSQGQDIIPSASARTVLLVEEMGFGDITSGSTSENIDNNADDMVGSSPVTVSVVKENRSCVLTAKNFGRVSVRFTLLSCPPYASISSEATSRLGTSLVRVEVLPRRPLGTVLLVDLEAHLLTATASEMSVEAGVTALRSAFCIRQQQGTQDGSLSALAEEEWRSMVVTVLEQQV